MTEALISPHVLRWARQRAHLPASVLAEKVSKKAPLWEIGEARPTFLQAQKLARLLHIPFGYLFLSEPPVEHLPLPDLRTIGDVVPGEISTDLREVIHDAQRKQDWYRDYAVTQGIEPLPFVGRFSKERNIADIARDVTATLGITDAFRMSVNNWKAFLSALINKAEDAGVLVMHSGIVGSNSRRPLHVSEFRGFAMSDPIAPLIFLNWKDAEAARIFTLIHELAHLWIGESGISDLSLGEAVGSISLDSEKLCNAVAAEVLVPELGFRQHWNDQLSVTDNAIDMTRHYRVSSVVIGRRAYELGMISWNEYQTFYQEQSLLWQKSQSGSGGNYYLNTRSRLGKRFATAVVVSVQQGNLLYRDAGRLLGVKPANIQNLSKELGF